MALPFKLDNERHNQRIDGWKDRLAVPATVALDPVLRAQYQVAHLLRPHGYLCEIHHQHDCDMCVSLSDQRFSHLLLSPRGVKAATATAAAEIHVCRSCNSHLQAKKNKSPPKLSIANGNW
jgi:hypothetical protein